MADKPRSGWVYCLILFILTLLFFYKLVLHPGQSLFSMDVISIVYFHENTISEALKNFGQVPLWSNFDFSGLPLIGNPILEFIYPISMLSFLFPPNLFVSYSFMIHVFFAGLFTYLFARKIKFSGFSSFISAVIFMFCAAVVGKIYPGHIISVIVISLIPLMFYLLERLIAEPNLKNSLIFGAAWCIQLLGGMLQFFYTCAIALAIYLLLRLIYLYASNMGVENRKKQAQILSIIGFASLGLVVCILLSAVYLIPTYITSKESGRTGGLSFETASHMSFDPKQLITLLVPNFFGSALDITYWGPWENPWVSYIYVGILPLLLALFGMYFRRGNYTKIFMIIGSLFLLYAFGRYTPFYRLAYYLVPGVSMFRVPSESVIMFCFSLAIIAGRGISSLVCPRGEAERMAQRRLLNILWVFAGLSVLLTAAIFLARAPIINYGTGLAEERYYSLHPGGEDFEERYLPKMGAVFDEISGGMLLFTALFLAGMLLLSLRVSNRLGIAIFSVLAVILIVADLWAFSLPSIQLKKIEDIYPQTELFQFLKNDNSRYRVLDLSGYIPQQVLPRYGIESITGYDPLVLNDYIQLTDLVANISEDYTLKRNILTNVPLEYADISAVSNTKVLDLLNVKYLISREPANLTGFELVLTKQDYMLEKDFDVFSYYSNSTLPLYVYENKEVLPRVFVVGMAKLEPDRAEILREMASLSFDPASYALLEKEVALPNLLPMLEGDAYAQETHYAGDALISYYSPNKILIEADMEKPGLLFLSEIWQQGWKATDNGNSTEVYRANYIFRAIYLSPGHHQIEMVYDPAPFKIGLFISIGAIALVLVSFAYLLFSKKGH